MVAAQVDTNRDGYISFDEFVALMANRVRSNHFDSEHDLRCVPRVRTG